ncbi:MAG: T9SS type A sorting domain-containing protein [Flavobacteriales bacterium]|jgi:hypothetical protein
MKPFKSLLAWAFVMLALVSNAQPWTYDFGTGTGTANNTTAGSGLTTFFSGTPSGGGTYRVRVGAGGGTIALVDPGSSLGAGTEAVLTATTGTSTNKFTIYGWSTPSAASYAKFDMRTASAGNGNIIIHFGSGAAATIYQDNAASTNYNTSLAVLRIVYTAGAISAIERRGATPSAAFYAIASSGIAAATDQTIEIYGNNASSSTSYLRGGTTYSLNAQSWDLWVAGTKVSPSSGWGTAGTLAANTTIAGLGFFGEGSTSNAASIILDNLEYSNALPQCTSPALQASAITFPDVTTSSLDLRWTAGDGTGRIVKMNSSNSFTAPTNGSNPTASLAWANASEQVIYNGTGEGPIQVTGLAQNTTYYFQVYEYCGAFGYNTTTALGNPNSQATATGPNLIANLLTSFGSQCLGSTYGPNSFTITGANLSTANVTVSSALSQYQFSTTAGGTYSNPLSIPQGGGTFVQNIYVQYTPNAVAAHNGNISVGGGGATSVNVAVSGSGISTAPPTIGSPTSALITATTAELSATVSLINCSDVIFRGIEWSTTNNFTNGTGTVISETGTYGTGTFAINATGLPANSTIYWKAFAENATDTTYTAQSSFTTLQEYLAIGDLSILGFNTTNPDEFVFVNWAPIKANMVIKFTDNGFNGSGSESAADNARGGENFVIWKNNTGAAIDPGTVIKINGLNTTLGQVVSGGLTAITTTDQIFAYQGPATTGANPDWSNNLNTSTFSGDMLFGLNIGGTGFLTTGTAASSSSYLPSELNVTDGSIAITGSVAGSQYTATRSALGSIIAYRSLVNNPANWTTATSGTITLNTTGFTINPNVATQIAVTSINGGVNPSANTPFTVSIETRDANGAAAPVGVNTNFSITLLTGSGAVSGTLTGTILAGAGTLDITGVVYNTAETGVVLRVSRTSGQTLTAGDSDAITVEEAGSQLAYASFETFAYTNNQLPTFSVEARRSDGAVDVNYTGSITIAMTSGTGTLLGTLTKTAVAGVAFFNDIIYDTEGVKVVEATASGLSAANSGNVTVSTPSVVEVILPQYIEGAQPSNSNRLPFVYRVTLNGLKPNSNFRFVNTMVLATDAATSFGAGNAIYVDPSGFTQSGSGVSLSTAGQYGTLSTDVNGSYTGWFVTEPTGNATRFLPGADIFPRITLNNGSGGTAAMVRFTTQNSVRVLSLSSLSSQGTALRGTSNATPKNMVFVYNNTEGTGRPISGSFIESDGFVNSAAANYAPFYANNVEGVSGAYGMIIPNTLAAGIRRIETRDLITGELGGCASTDADGIWPSGANTVNPTGGSATPIVISTADAPLAPSPEVCNNYIDDDCDGLIDEACPGNFANDTPGGALNLQYNVNSIYPNCYPYSGNNTIANNSSESAIFNGPDSWYRFVAQSSAVSITMSSTTMDDAIALYSRNGLVYTLIASENASSGLNDSERLNYSGLTVGQTYYISFSEATGGAGGAYNLCLQYLLPSGCSSIEPAGGFSLCDAYRASYRGAPSQGVTYAFEFNGIGGGASGTTSISATNGLIVLSNNTLALRWGGEYDVIVDVSYALTNTAGDPELIVVEGTSTTANCSGVSIKQHPLLEVRSSQRCPASLLRSNFLVGDRVGVTGQSCGATSYTYEFTQVTSCEDGTVISVAPSLYTTTSAAPYLPLGVLTALPNPGAWDVKIRPNFAYGQGTFGPTQRIRVNGTAASVELPEEALEQERSMMVESDTWAVYPNPTSGEFVNIALSNLAKGQLHVRVLDASGRAITTRAYTVEGSFNTTLAFDQQLSAGIYIIELTHSGRVQTQRLVVQ